MEATNLADLYELPLMDWTPVEAQLGPALTQAPGTGGPNRHTCWLTTVNADGSPHVTAVGALWEEGAFWVCASAASRKARNLAREPRCAVAVATLTYDLVVEGTGSLVVDPDVVARMASLWADGDWPCRVDESGTAITAPYSAPSAGPPPWSVYQVTPRSATAVGTVEPGGATRWSF